MKAPFGLQNLDPRAAVILIKCAFQSKQRKIIGEEYGVCFKVLLLHRFAFLKKKKNTKFLKTLKLLLSSL